MKQLPLNSSSRVETISPALALIMLGGDIKPNTRLGSIMPMISDIRNGTMFPGEHEALTVSDKGEGLKGINLLQAVVLADREVDLYVTRFEAPANEAALDKALDLLTQ